MGWNYVSILKLQRLYRWSLGMDKWFHPTLYWVCNYVFMLEWKLSMLVKGVSGKRKMILHFLSVLNIVIAQVNESLHLDPFILHNRYHWYYSPRYVKSQGISNHGNDLILPEYCGFSTRGVKLPKFFANCMSNMHIIYCLFTLPKQKYSLSLAA